MLINVRSKRSEFTAGTRKSSHVSEISLFEIPREFTIGLSGLVDLNVTLKLHKGKDKKKKKECSRLGDLRNLYLNKHSLVALISQQIANVERNFA